MPADYQQHPPFAVQLEAIEGCNLRCGFCGIRGIRPTGGIPDALSGPYRYMQPETLVKALRDMAQANWNPRLEWAMHGEPTLHPYLAGMVWLCRRYLPRAPILITTNGIPLLHDWHAKLEQLYTAGADTIAVDDYRPYRCRGAVNTTNIPGVQVLDYPADRAGNPHRRPRRGEKRLILVEDISQASDGTHSHLSNHAGSAGPLDDRYNQERCALPFRELSIRWDGNVALCCNDWRGQFKIANVLDMPIWELWQHERLQAARRRLANARRDFAPCQGCTHRTYRNGLLPDARGKVQLTVLPDDTATLAQACMGRPYTEPVPRRWEKTDGPGTPGGDAGPPSR